ncbi:MAG: bifunctional salicylyl-CoA 5-hydroxylase/oxidoreductase [Gammaproteobacteria bacterium]|nr:bifunctional salicylyl-CoA 5-hydroxylase/oxidoreductase [Gammaproteobacteria bacterium]
MKVVCIGGGPAGLYSALLLKRLDARHDITVVERNRPYDTFGWGVVFSDATMDNMRRADAPTAEAIEQAFNHWDDIELHFKGRVIRSGGHGFIGIGRKRLLNILQRRCEELGVQLLFEREVSGEEEFPDADLIVASDGINSRIRERHAGHFEPDVVARPNRYVWLGTHKRFDAFTFIFERTEHGWFQAHVYQFDADTSTFIVECPESVWQAHGLDRADQAETIAFCERLFARQLDGARLMANARHLRGSAWLNFQRVRCERWWLTRGRCHLVLMGDAVHTAHFAIGSGTKLALEDAIELAQRVGEIGSAPERLPQVLQAYQEARAVDVARLQNAAWNAMEWFEVCGRRYCEPFEPEQLMYSLLTRSQRISHENLRLRDPSWLQGYERWFAARAGAPTIAGASPVPPMFTPYGVRGITLENRVVVSPMAQYSAIDGRPTDHHLVHLGARALGGAALVLTEMTCVSAEGRITPGCPGLYEDAQAAAWRRIVDWVHGNSRAKIGVQIGHSGAKGSTRRGWDGIDLPLRSEDGESNWPLRSASAQQYLEGISQWSRAMTRADMIEVLEQFAAATRRATAAGFDWLELHCAHGYLLSSFISPLTNRRQDAYGGTLAARLRYPLEVFEAVRAAWPEDRPISVRISANDWVDGGITPADAVEVAAAFAAAGADLIDCSSGQVSKRERPVYGRMFQTPFADRIRQEAGIPTIAVGAISEADHVNSIVAAGRADLCAIARPHLANPAWTLNEAARIGYTAINWPKPYRAGQAPLENQWRREAASRTGLVGRSPGERP